MSNIVVYMSSLFFLLSMFHFISHALLPFYCFPQCQTSSGKYYQIYNNNNNNIKCLTSFLTTNSNTTRISPSSYFMLQTLLRVLPLCVCVQKWDKMVIWLLLRKSLVEQKCNRFFRLCNSNDFKSKYEFSWMRVYRSMEVPFFWVIIFELCRLFTIIASSVKLNGNGRQ